MRLLVGPLVRLLGALAALTLIAAGVVLAVDAASTLAGVGPVVLPDDWIDSLRDTRWSDAEVARALWIGLAVGVLCLVVALWPRPPSTMPSSLEGYEVERRSFEQSLQRRLEMVDGVRAAKVRAGRRRLRARVDTTRTSDTGSVERAVQERAIDIERRLALNVGSHDVSVRRVRP